tara:strand:+ start:610 stop:792 length:183 start_codon:yes stop_codon:yes gene_type:complete
MKEKLKDWIVFGQLLVILFLCYTIWELQVDVLNLNIMFQDLERLLMDILTGRYDTPGTAV